MENLAESIEIKRSYDQSSVILVRYDGNNNIVANITNYIFTLFRDTFLRTPEKGFYFAKIFRNTLDKNGNTMYVVDLISQVPTFLVPKKYYSSNFFGEFYSDCTSFDECVEFLTSTSLIMNRAFFRVMYALSCEKFRITGFTKKDLINLYNSICNGKLTASGEKNLTEVMKRFKGMVIASPEKYFKDVLEAVSTRQPTEEVKYEIMDINNELNQFISQKFLKFVSVPVLYNNMESKTVELSNLIVDNLKNCSNYELKIIIYKNNFMFKFKNK